MKKHFQVPPPIFSAASNFHVPVKTRQPGLNKIMLDIYGTLFMAPPVMRFNLKTSVLIAIHVPTLIDLT